MSFLKRAFHSIQNFWLKGYSFSRFLVTFMGEKINIIKKKKLIQSVNLDDNEIRQAQTFFKKWYGKKIPLYWHRLYQSFSGIYRKDYFPEILFSTKYEPMVNPFRPIAAQFGDKNLLHQLFGRVEGVEIPRTFFSCVNGVYRNSNHLIISRQQLCQSVGDMYAVIKKTVDSSSGRDVQIVDMHNGIDAKSGKRIEELIGEYGENFVIQDLIKQHELLSRINPSSLNTFRVMTYILNNKVNVCPIALRVGRNGADRDNIHYGGITVGIDDSGRLREYAFSEFGERFTEHPDTHVVFSETVLPFVDVLREKAILLHSELPWLKVISWDLSINEKGNVVLIEANTVGQSAWFPQMANGEALFGDNTSEILHMICRRQEKN